MNVGYLRRYLEALPDIMKVCCVSDGDFMLVKKNKNLMISGGVLFIGKRSEDIVLEDEETTNQINWIKCSDRMPPDRTRFILHDITYDIHYDYGHTTPWFEYLATSDKFEWTPFTEEAWKELNK